MKSIKLLLQTMVDPSNIRKSKNYAKNSPFNIASPLHTTHKVIVKLRLQIKLLSKSSRKQSMKLVVIGTCNSIPHHLGLPYKNLHPHRSYTILLSLGSEVILPLEIEIPSLCLSLLNILPDEEYRVARLQELKLLDERCLKALNHLWVYQYYLWLSYNKKVRTWEFDIGDLCPSEKLEKYSRPWKQRQVWA